MLPVIDTIECQRDSPHFRQVLDVNERNLDVLENKLDKIVKQCSQMVSAGRIFNQEQEQLVHCTWELSNYFSDNSVVQGALNCLLDALRETANYHKILIDQAARAIIKNFSNIIKDDLKSVKEKRHWFEKASLELDSVLQRAAAVTKTNESDELNKQVWATRQAFRHTSIDYMHALSMLQAKKRHEVLDSILSYAKAYNTFFHQGSDLCDDLKPAFDKISNEIHEMRTETSNLEKAMENRHFDISGKDLILTDDHRNSMYPVTMQGYLFKRTNNAFKTWNRRYFTLQNNQLVYRKRSGEEVTVMEEDLRLCSVKPAVDSERRFCFEITSNMKSHILQAESEESCQEWREALMRAILSALQHNDSPLSPVFGSSESSLQLSTSSATPSPSGSPASSKYSPSKGSDSSKNKLFGEILKIPGNKVCCDCGSPDPKWASINLGITLCIECSGIHRSLGVHYSKVRSLTLDKWDIEVIRVMEKLGNDVINQVYLSDLRRAESVFHAKLEKQSETSIIPATPDCSRSIREAWIRAKYIDRRFVTPLGNEKIFYKILNQSKTFQERKQVKRIKNKASPNSSPRGASPHGGLAASISAPLLNAPPPLHAVLETALTIGCDKDAVPPDAAESVASDDSLSLAGEQPFENLNLSSLTPEELLLSSSQIAHIPLMCLSLALRADKNIQNAQGRNPLHLSVISKSAVAVEYLLLNGVRVNTEDNEGRTALHLAAMDSNILQVFRLIKYRADWKIRDYHQKTATDYAVESNEPDLVTLLRVATLSEQLDKEDVDEEMTTIMQELYRKKCPLLVHEEDSVVEDVT